MALFFESKSGSIIIFRFIVYTLNLLDFFGNNTLFKARINLKELWEIVLL
jgi:hypothetical protein